MLTTDALYSEIKSFEKIIASEKDPFKAATLKAQVLNLKLLHNIRTNTVQVMKHFNIDQVKAKGRDAQEA